VAFWRNSVYRSKIETFEQVGGKLLEIKREQQQLIADYAFRERVVSFLRNEVLPLTQSMSDAELRVTVDRAMESGREIGVTSERELMKWALIGILSQGSAFENENIKGPLRNLGVDDQTKVETLLRELSREIEFRS
jgi:hypothetical protein